MLCLKIIGTNGKCNQLNYSNKSKSNSTECSHIKLANEFLKSIKTYHISKSMDIRNQ